MIFMLLFFSHFCIKHQANLFKYFSTVKNHSFSAFTANAYFSAFTIKKQFSFILFCRKEKKKKKKKYEKQEIVHITHTTQIASRWKTKIKKKLKKREKIKSFHNWLWKVEKQKNMMNKKSVKNKKIKNKKLFPILPFSSRLFCYQK